MTIYNKILPPSIADWCGSWGSAIENTNDFYHAKDNATTINVDSIKNIVREEISNTLKDSMIKASHTETVNQDAISELRDAVLNIEKELGISLASKPARAHARDALSKLEEKMGMVNKKIPLLLNIEENDIIHFYNITPGSYLNIFDGSGDIRIFSTIVSGTYYKYISNDALPATLYISLENSNGIQEKSIATCPGINLVNF